MRIRDAVAVITGAAGGIGRAVALQLAKRGAHGLALVDDHDSVAEVAAEINRSAQDWICLSFRGDVTDNEFRRAVYQETRRRCGTVNLCVPACVRRRGQTPHRQAETELISPFSWALEMVAGIRESQGPESCTRWPQDKPFQGVVVLFGPGMLHPHGPPLECPTAEARLKRTAKLLAREASHHGVGCGVVFSKDDPLSSPVRASGDSVQTIFPRFQIQDSIALEDIAASICFLISMATPKAWASEEVVWPGRC